MPTEVTLRQAGGSVSDTVPSEMARRFHLAPGDLMQARVQAIETERGTRNGCGAPVPTCPE